MRGVTPSTHTAVRERNKRICALYDSGTTRNELARQFKLSITSIYMIINRQSDYIAHARSNGDNHKDQYARAWSKERTAKLRALQEPSPEQVAKLRSGIEEFRQMLEERYGPPPQRLAACR
jgi:hypothetical protein